MERDRLSRKLAVILHADVVGSTSLVQKNETLAHERIQAAFHKFSETIHSYGGITCELRGDALVAEFERASRGAQLEPSLAAYLQAWRRLVTEHEEEGSALLRLLETMSDEAASPSSRMIHADDAARGGDGALFVASLERELDETPDELALGAALAIAEVADVTGLTDRRTALLRAEERLRGEPTIGRALLLDDALGRVSLRIPADSSPAASRRYPSRESRGRIPHTARSARDRR